MRNLLDAVADAQQAQKIYNNQRLAIAYWVMLAILFVAIVTITVIIVVHGIKRRRLLESLFNDPLSSLQTMETYCDFCGAVIDNDATVCPNCGATLVSEDENVKNKS